MGQFNAEFFGTQLKNEIRAAGIDVKTLRARLMRHLPEARGTSYGAVWGYVNGQAPVEPRREVVAALADIFGVLPSYLLSGGPRTEDARRAELMVKEQEEFNEFEALLAEIVPEYDALQFEERILFVDALKRFLGASPREWSDDKAHGNIGEIAAFLVALRQFLFGPLWLWTDAPDLTERSVRDYVRHALGAFVATIPTRLPRRPVYRLETYHGQSPATPHLIDHWRRYASAAVIEAKNARRAPKTTRKKRRGPH